MKLTLLSLFSAFVALSAQAQTAPTGLVASPAFSALCASGVNAVPNKPGWWHYVRPSFAVSTDTLFSTQETSDGQYAVVKITQSSPAQPVELARFKSVVRDINFHDGKIWALFADHFVSIDAATGAISAPVQSSAQPEVTNDTSAYAFAWVGDQLVIAHGSYGMTAFDHGTRLAHTATLNLRAGGKISKAIEVKALNATEAVFAAESLTLEDNPPFTFQGLIIADASGSNVQPFAYDAKTSGSISQARLLVDGDALYVNNWGILQKISVSAMKQAGAITISWIPTKTTVNGQSYTAELLGSMLIDQGRIVACSDVPEANQATHKVVHHGLVYPTP